MSFKTKEQDCLLGRDCLNKIAEELQKLSLYFFDTCIISDPLRRQELREKLSNLMVELRRRSPLPPLILEWSVGEQTFKEAAVSIINLAQSLPLHAGQIIDWQIHYPLCPYCRALLMGIITLFVKHCEGQEMSDVNFLGYLTANYPILFLEQENLEARFIAALNEIENLQQKVGEINLLCCNKANLYEAHKKNFWYEVKRTYDLWNVRQLRFFQGQLLSVRKQGADSLEECAVLVRGVSPEINAEYEKFRALRRELKRLQRQMFKLQEIKEAKRFILDDELRQYYELAGRAYTIVAQELFEVRNLYTSFSAQSQEYEFLRQISG